MEHTNDERKEHGMELLSDVIRAYGWDQPNSTGYAKKIVEQIIGRLQRRLPAGQEVRLTALQRKVLNHPLFRPSWKEGDRPPRNLIIQGATSAGKTLVSDISILDVLEHDRKAVVLVPLKAMVRERVEQLNKDVASVRKGIRIYGSSSDYLDHDELIINGSFDIAVIVYEKYFAFLSQSGGALLRDVKLLVVDELSMLSKEERGPKLEMALEITRTYAPDTRIICLATSDCNADQIAFWLDAGADGIIRCAQRPVSLNEHILRRDGTGRKRHIPSEAECGEDDLNEEWLNEMFPPEEVSFEIPGYNAEMPERERKQRLLTSVIRSVYRKAPGAKVLVFVGSKADTKYYSRFLVSDVDDIFPAITGDAADEEYRKTLEEINACDDDDDRDAIGELMKRGIAYHNSGVSTVLREIVEKEFQRIDSPVNVIVATETLTVGVNMPFDVMIMLDSKVPKGLGARASLTNQEYRNYIGRAGRLGLIDSAGETYLFVDEERDFNTYWRGFYDEGTRISSALTGTKEDVKAPYYLSLLQFRRQNRDDYQFGTDDLEQLYKSSLAYPFEQERGDRFDASRMQDALKKAQLIADAPLVFGLDDDTPRYNLTQFGRKIAPYALSLYSCKLIYAYFLTGAMGYGLPARVPQEDIDDDRYLLEILFHVCLHSEVQDFSNMLYPSETVMRKSSVNPAACIRRALNEIMKETAPDGTPRHKLWCEDDRQLCIYRIWRADMNELDVRELQAAMRAILIYYWTQGMEFRPIMKKTEFQSFLRGSAPGDLERLAEIVSFHLDAIHASLEGHTRKVPEDPDQIVPVLEDASSFYSLQTRVKYGMKRDLVKLANKHIHGLDRGRLLRFGRLAEERGVSAKDLLFSLGDTAIRAYMTGRQRNLLIQRIERRFNVRGSDFDGMCRILRQEQPGKNTDAFIECLQDIWDWEGDVSFLYRRMSMVFSLTPQAGTLVPDERDGCFEWGFTVGGKRRRARFAVLGPRAEDRRAQLEKLEYLRQSSCDGRIVIARIDRSSPEEDARYYTELLADCGGSFDLALSGRLLTDVLLQAYKEQDQAAYVLFQFLTDAFGIFLEQRRINLSMQNYLPRSSDTGDLAERFYLLASYDDNAYDGKGITEIRNELTAVPSKNCYVLPWGTGLTDAIDQEWFYRSLTLIYLNREDVIHSKSLTKFMYHMANLHYLNCYALFGSRNMEELWMNEQADPGHVRRWLARNNQVRCLDADRTQEIVRCVSGFWPGSWKIAISYAHYDPDRPAGQRHDPEQADRRATELLDRLYDRLVDEFGEQLVFYDRNPEHGKVFLEEQAKLRSLEVYQSCRFGLFLCNYWSINNGNCIEERRAVKEGYARGTASYMYLVTNGTDACDPDDENDFSVDIKDTESIVKRIRDALTRFPG